MKSEQIRTGQIWTADLYGHTMRVQVICSDAEIPDSWICERLGDRGNHGPGSLINVSTRDLLKLETSADESAR
jgi:hypothetical protein